jgi:hypothetical protein
MENKYGEIRSFAVHKIVSEYAERIYAYMEKMHRDKELRI